MVATSMTVAIPSSEFIIATTEIDQFLLQNLKISEQQLILLYYCQHSLVIWHEISFELLIKIYAICAITIY